MRYGRYSEEEPEGKDDPGIGPCVRCGDPTGELLLCLGCSRFYKVGFDGQIYRRGFF